MNNLEADHLNYYEDLAHVQRTVLDAFAANARLETVCVNADDPGSAALVPTLRERGLRVLEPRPSPRELGLRRLLRKPRLALPLG